MIFKCYLCKDYKFWNKQCYEVVVTSNDNRTELFTKKLCRTCGEGMDSVYSAGKQIADMKVVDEDDREDNSIHIPKLD